MTDKIPLLEGRTKLTAEYLAMTPLQKWETLTLNGLLGTDEPWIEDMRQHLARKAASAEGLAEALKRIDGEAPAKESSAKPTVGFPPSRDPEYDDGNSIVEEAFDEGVARGLWIAAQIARDALGAERDG